MRRRVFVISALLLTSWETGCGSVPALFSTANPTEGSYSCALADAFSPAVSDPAAPSALRHRSVTVQKAGDQIVLYFGAGNTQRLNPVTGAQGRLFANADYGWRIAGTRGVLTDVQNIRTYNCKSAAQQAATRVGTRYSLQ